jgi:hypothetical protein
MDALRGIGDDVVQPLLERTVSLVVGNSAPAPVCEERSGQTVRAGHYEGRVQTRDAQDDLWRCLGVVSRSFEQTLPFGFILLLNIKMWGSAGRIREHSE